MTKIMDALFEIIFNSGSDIDDFKSVICKMREEDDPELA